MNDFMQEKIYKSNIENLYGEYLKNRISNKSNIFGLSIYLYKKIIIDKYTLYSNINNEKSDIKIISDEDINGVIYLNKYDDKKFIYEIVELVINEKTFKFENLDISRPNPDSRYEILKIRSFGFIDNNSSPKYQDTISFLLDNEQTNHTSIIHNSKPFRVIE